MKTKMLCGMVIGMLALAGAATGQDIAVDVTFSVDMGVQIAATNFDPATQSVLVRGGFNGWGEGSALTRVGATTVYSGTFSVTGPGGGAVEYKFYKTNVGDAGWESLGNRSFNLGPAGSPQVLDTVYFNNQGPVGPEITLDVTFSVDMGVQIAATNFDPATQSVLVRGGFNGWGEGSVLAREGATTVYSGTFSVTGPEGGAVEYKFYKTNVGDAGWESFVGNRSFNLGPAGSPQVLDTVYFNNQGPVGPEITVDVSFSVDMGVQIAATNFDPATQSVLVRGGFNGWGEGAVLAREGATTVYSGTFSVTGPEGGAVEYKFYMTGLEDLGYESIGNRSFNLGPAGATQVLATVYFSNQGPVGSTLSFTGGTWDPSALGAYPFELTRTGEVGDEIALTSSNPDAVTVPASVSFAAGQNTVSFDVTVASLTAGEATIVASNAASGAWAEYTVKPVAPGLSFTDGTWNPSAAGDYVYTLARVGAVSDAIVLSSTDAAVLTVPAGMSFAEGAGSLTFTATVVSVTSGPATIVASNAATGAWAEYIVTPVGAILTIGGPWLVESLGALEYTLERTPSVGATVLLSSSDPTVLTVPVDLLFGESAYATTFPAVAVGYGAATIVASNAASGAWAEYNVTVQRPSNPNISSITFVAGTGAFRFAVPDGFDLGKVQGAGTALTDGDLEWTDLSEGEDYTFTDGEIEISTQADGASRQLLIRIWLMVDPTR